MKFVFLIFFVGCSVIGKKPSGVHLKKIKLSPQWDSDRGKFKNRQQDKYDEMIKDFNYWTLLKQQFLGKENREPNSNLPEIIPDLKMFSTMDGPSYIWLGHSTILLRLGGKTILFDPVFTNASPVGLFGSRFQDPVISLENLPHVDYVFLSHDHYDHLDKESVEYLFTRKNIQFFTPLGVSSYLIGWGLSPERVMEFDWWDEFDLGSIRLALTPGQHFSGRAGMQTNPTLWGSWVLMTDQHRIFFSGDTGYDIHFSQIGEKYGPFDLVFMEDGQYNEMWYMSHLRPEEAVQAAIDIRARAMQPIHWGMYKLAIHDWNEPVEIAFQQSKNKKFNFIAAKLGEIVMDFDRYKTTQWWN